MPLGYWFSAENTMIDAFFLLAAGALGWGLSLATYRLLANRKDWPMGRLHADVPLIPVVIGVASLVIGLIFAAARGSDSGGLWIIAAGVVFAILWISLLRVGSQVSLFLAPAAAAVLVLGYFGFPFPGNYDLTPAGYKTVRTISPYRIEDRTIPAEPRR